MTTQTTGAAELPEALRPEMLDDLIATFESAGRGNYNLMRVELPRHQWTQLAEALRAQPAGAQVPEAVLQAIRAAGMHLIRGMNDVYSLIPAMNATAQPAGAATPAAPAQLRQEGELLQLARAYKEYIDALPADVVAALPAMPGVDGDWADEVLDRAARAAPQPANPWLRALEIRMAQGWNLKGDRIPVLYTDTINGDGVGRDDLWLCTTSALAAPQPAVTAETVDALVIAEAALADIGDADREPGDDVAWCEARAAQALPMVRAALAAQREVKP